MAGIYVGALLEYSTPASSSVQTTITFAKLSTEQDFDEPQAEEKTVTNRQEVTSGTGNKEATIGYYSISRPLCANARRNGPAVREFYRARCLWDPGTVASHSADAEHLTYARTRRRSASTLNYRA